MVNVLRYKVAGWSNPPPPPPPPHPPLYKPYHVEKYKLVAQYISCQRPKLNRKSI